MIRGRSFTATSERERRASLASVSSARSMSMESSGSTENSCRVRMTLLKSPTKQTAFSPAKTDTLTSPSSFSNPLGSPLFALDNLGLPDVGASTQPSPVRGTSPLPAMPNERYDEQRVYDELGLSVASISPLQSSRVSPMLDTDVPLGSASLSSPRRAFLNNQLNSSPPKLALPEPVELEEITDDILLPFADRPAEIAELMQLSRNKWVFDQIREALSCLPVAEAKVGSPTLWTWQDFEAHLLSPRSQMPDKVFVERAEACLRKRAEVIWERLRTIIGYEAPTDDDNADSFMRSPIQIDALFEGDTLVDSQKAGEEVQQRSMQSPDQSPRSAKRHIRGRSSSSAALSTSRSRQMQPISESEDGDADAVSRQEPQTPASPSGRILGLRMIAAASPSSFHDLPNLARSASTSTDFSQGSSLPDRDAYGSPVADDVRRLSNFFRGFFDVAQYALVIDDEGDARDAPFAAFKPKISSGFGPALPSLEVLMASS